MKICLIACRKEKLPHAAPAKDLYQALQFKKSRRWVEATFDRWYIVSGKYGFVDPEEVLEPYDLSLLQVPKSERLEWSERVSEAILDATEPGDEITFLAERTYHEHVIPVLKEAGRKVETPTAGLSSGAIHRWLNERLAELE